MKLRSALVCICLTALSSIAALAQDEGRAVVSAATWQVQKYDIVATLPATEADRGIALKAVLTLRNVSNSPATSLTFRISPAAEISSISFNGSSAEFTKREEKIDAARSLQRISVRVPSVASGASATTTVDYKLVVKENSGVSAVSPIGAHLLPQSFWYPTPNSWYFARGADYAPYRIQVNNPNSLLSVSSGVQAGQVYEQKLNGQPFFIARSWEVANVAGVAVLYPKDSGPEAQARASELATIASNVRDFAANLLGPAPDVPLRIVASRRGAGFSEGGVMIVDEGVFRRAKLDSQTVVSIAEAIVRTWIGTGTAITGEGQGVIREGLPRFIATEFIESKFGKDVADIERTRQRSAYAAIAQREEPLATVSSVNDFYFSEVANKGAMIWRLLDRRLGRQAFFETIRSSMKDGYLDLSELRGAFSNEKEYLDHLLDQSTDTNLLVGLPQSVGTETRVALRNTGGIDTTVTVKATTATGEHLPVQASIKARSFSEAVFKSTAKIVRVEVDVEKLYPQIEYSDDVAPREFTDGDRLLAVKRLFDKQDFAGAEAAARTVLREMPRFDDVRTLLARSLLALGKNSEAEREFRSVLEEKLPTARSLAWAGVGLGEISAKSGQNQQALKFAEAVIVADIDYGASLAARNLRNRLDPSGPSLEEAKLFFGRFDKAATSNRKSEVEALVLPGEVARFASSVSGSTEQWQTKVVRADKLDADTILVETTIAAKLLNRDPESGTAVFRLARAGGSWKLAGVEMFEVR